MPEKQPPRYEILPLDVDLRPSQPVHGVDMELQAQSMRSLRELHNEIPNGYIKRDRQMQAWALSNSLSRQDMAIAIGVHKTRVDQIVRELTLLDQERKAMEIIARMRPHLTDELFQEVLKQNPALAEYYEDMGEAGIYEP